MYTTSLLSILTLILSLSLSLSALTASSSSSSTFSTIRRSIINGPCTGPSNAPGVCIPTSKCTQAGGTFISDACPGTPGDIKCCTKPVCGTNDAGNCRFTSSCASGIVETNECPGPDGFKCCMPASSGGGSGGGYAPPTIPSSSSGCKIVAIGAAKEIVDAFPGKVKSVGCIRECGGGESSDHCEGMATDMMVADGGGRVMTGQPIAEWVKDHCADLSCKYVMWGQRIWERGVTSASEDWEEWPYQKCTTIPNCVNGDRGGNTANHWDHVHVSYQ